VINLCASANAYRRVWLRVGRGGSREERFNDRPDNRKCKSVYIIATPGGVVEQCIVRPKEVRPPGRGWRFYEQRKRWSVWRRPYNERIRSDQSAN
jgi:hypothetical protein